VISASQLLIGFLLPALACVLLGALAARQPEGRARKLIQALALLLPYLLAAGYVPFLMPLFSATQLVPLLALPVAVLAALVPFAVPVLASVAIVGALCARLGAPPGWPERIAAMIALALAWHASRASAERPAWRALLALATFAGAVAFACLCGRSASLALVAGGLGAAIGASFVASLLRPKWSPGQPGQDVGVFALGGSLACAVYLAELSPLAALALLGSLAATRIPSFALAFAAQLVLTALGIALAWPAGGLGA
jgi:hypothetical protein